MYKSEAMNIHVPWGGGGWEAQVTSLGVKMLKALEAARSV